MSLENLNCEKICGLCSINPSKYCCPRCDILYCSLSCYQSEKHVQCSESFYRDCVNEELALQKVDSDKKNIYNILKKSNEENNDGEDLSDYIGTDSDDDSQLDLHERLNGLNLNNADEVWNALTEDEKNEFEALLRKGDITSIVPHWEPWWMHYSKKSFVQEISEDNNIENKALKECPTIKTVPKFDSLTSMKPSPAISFNITNVLASYAFVMRYFNGDVDALEMTKYLMDICCNLSKNVNFDDPELAIETVAQRCLLSDLIETDKTSLDVMKNDTFQILRGPSDDNNLYYSKAALSHIMQILTDAKSALKRVKPEKTEVKKGTFTKKFPDHDSLDTNIDKGKVTKIIKKIEFYLSFLNSCDTVDRQTE